jgi:hypothetical protein
MQLNQEYVMKCKPGDLAIIVNDVHASNIGSIVRVIKECEDQKGNDVIWNIFSKHPIACLANGALTYRKRGVANDCDLSPIKGLEKVKIPKNEDSLPFYEVNEYGTLVDPSVPEPTIRRDVFDIWTKGIKTTNDLISAIQDCTPLEGYFQQLGQDRKYEVEEQLDVARGSKKQHLEALFDALDDEDSGWIDWLKLDGQKSIRKHINVIEEWLNEAIDWSESEWFSSSNSGQEQAKLFFHYLDQNVLDELGIVIVEGCHPGSSYYAAELRNDIENANITSRKLGLKFRFKTAQ